MSDIRAENYSKNTTENEDRIFKDILELAERVAALEKQQITNTQDIADLAQQVAGLAQKLGDLLKQLVELGVLKPA